MPLVPQKIQFGSKLFIPKSGRKFSRMVYCIVTFLQMWIPHIWLFFRIGQNGIGKIQWCFIGAIITRSKTEIVPIQKKNQICCSSTPERQSCRCCNVIFCHLLHTSEHTITLYKHIKKKCHPLAFVCPGEKCIPASYVCDGIYHCKGKADEFCGLPDHFLSSPAVFVCKHFENLFIVVLAFNGFEYLWSGLLLEKGWSRELFPSLRMYNIVFASSTRVATPAVWLKHFDNLLVVLALNAFEYLWSGLLSEKGWSRGLSSSLTFYHSNGPVPWIKKVVLDIWYKNVGHLLWA